MKKIALILAIVMICAVLCSCEHQHIEGSWSADTEHHWRVCAKCGELLEFSAHAFGEKDVCVVCGADEDGHIHKEDDGHGHEH